MLGYTPQDVRRYRDQVRHGDRSAMPGAARASAGINTTAEDVARLLAAVARIAGGGPPPVPYRQDPCTGDYHPRVDTPRATALAAGASGALFPRLTPPGPAGPLPVRSRD